MGLRFADQVHHVVAGTTATITPRETESIRINRISFSGAAGAGTAIIRIGRMIVGFIPVATPGLFNMFPAEIHGQTLKSLYDLPEQYGINLKYPIATGENFSITTSIACDITVEYDIFDAGDVSNTEENGTMSNTLTYIVTLTNATPVTTTIAEAYHRLDGNMNPSEFPRFPIERVPAGITYEIKAMAALAFSGGNGTNNHFRTRHVRLKHNRQVLFDPLERGFRVYNNTNNVTTVGEFSQNFNELPINYTFGGRLHSFEPVLTLREGDIFDTELSLTGAVAGTMPANFSRVYYIVTARRG